MTDCVVTSHAGTEDGEPCLQRGAHGGDCPGDACEGCAPTPAAPKKLVCTRHEDGVRDALQAFGDLYAALGEPTTYAGGGGAQSEGDVAAGHIPGCTVGLDPASDEVCFGCAPATGGAVDARMLIRSTLVGWCKVLEDDFGIPLPDEREIADDTRGAVLRRQWDVDLAVQAQRRTPAVAAERRAHLAQVAESHRRAAALLRDERAAGVDVIRALAGHVDDHRPKLLADMPLDMPADASLQVRAGVTNPGISITEMSHLQHRDRGRIFAEDILDVHARARGLAYPRRTALRIRCSCGARVAVDTDTERYYTCPGCGEYGTLDYWKRREAPPMTSEPMPLAELPEWLLRHHRLPVTLEQLRHWAKGVRAVITHTEAAGRDERGRRTPALFDPVTVLAVARKKAERGRRSA